MSTHSHGIIAFVRTIEVGDIDPSPGAQALEGEGDIDAAADGEIPASERHVEAPGRHRHGHAIDRERPCRRGRKSGMMIMKMVVVVMIMMMVVVSCALSEGWDQSWWWKGEN
jgi:hypothetical protein